MNTHTQELLLKAHATPFSYDHDRGVFLSGENIIEPENLSRKGLVVETEPLRIPDTPLVQTVIHPVALPSMFDWLAENFNNDIEDETVDVMRNVFIRLNPEMSKSLLTRDKGGFMGFNVMLQQADSPDIFLQTVGNCACMHAVEGMFSRDDHMVELGFHNIDTPAQETSLLAGIGHLAHLAAAQ